MTKPYDWQQHRYCCVQWTDSEVDDGGVTLFEIAEFGTNSLLRRDIIETKSMQVDDFGDSDDDSKNVLVPYPLTVKKGEKQKLCPAIVISVSDDRKLLAEALKSWEENDEQMELEYTAEHCMISGQRKRKLTAKAKACKAEKENNESEPPNKKKAEANETAKDTWKTVLKEKIKKGQERRPAIAEETRDEVDKSSVQTVKEKNRGEDDLMIPIDYGKKNLKTRGWALKKLKNFSMELPAIIEALETCDGNIVARNCVESIIVAENCDETDVTITEVYNVAKSPSTSPPQRKFKVGDLKLVPSLSSGKTQCPKLVADKVKSPSDLKLPSLSLSSGKTQCPKLVADKVKSPNKPINSVFGMSVDEKGFIDVCGTLIRANDLVFVPPNDLRRAVYKITPLVFSHDELLNCSITGTAANAFKGTIATKGKLPENKKNALNFVVKQIYPSVTEKQIDNELRKKLNIYCKVNKKPAQVIEARGDPDDQSMPDITDDQYTG